MKRLILAFLFSLIISLSAFSQQAEKIDEFIPDDCETVLSKLDSFASDLQNEPKSKGFIVFYEGAVIRYGKKYPPAPGETEHLIKSFQSYLIRARNIPESNLEIINGGFRKENSIELWIASPNSERPTPIPTLKKLTYKKRKFVKLCIADIAPFVF